MPSTARRTHYWVTFTVLSVAVASYTLMQSLTIPVLSDLEREFDTDQGTVTWLLTGYLLSASVFTPIMGRLGDTYGKQRLLVISLVALAVGSLAAALAPTIGVLIAARVIQGIGGGVLPLAFGIIRDEFPLDKIGGAVSVVSSLLAVGFGTGIVLAGPLTSALGFRWLFWLPFIVTGLAAVVAVLVVPESPVRTPGRIALFPALLLSSWLVALLLGLSQAPKWGWGDPRTIGLLIAAVILVAAWIRVELVVDVPLIDMKMMRLPGVWTTNLVALLLGVGMYASLAFIAQFNQTPSANGYGFGSSTTESGMILLPSAVMTFVTGLIAAPIARRIGPKAVVVIGSAVGAVGMFLTAAFHAEPWQVAVSNGVTGAGIGLAFACLAGLIVAAVTPAQTGVASGMNANIRTIGGSIGTAVMASIVTASFLPSGFPKEAGYTVGFVVLGAAMVAAAVAGLAIPTISEKKIQKKLDQERNAFEVSIMSV